ncbi:MAG: hypothetical protein HOP23_03660 [Methylococcaceae bacterium]|nr:hypothetical protein [Methylococcaceae bacterium]
MAPPTNRKLFYSVALIGIAIIITIPDVVFSLMLDILHSIFDLFLELLHTLFEGIESVLDHLVEHFFHTEVHDTQLIVFYTLMLMALGMGYGLLKLLVPLYLRAKNNLRARWEREKQVIAVYWIHLSWVNKIKLIAITGSLAYLFFLVSF